MFLNNLLQWWVRSKPRLDQDFTSVGSVITFFTGKTCSSLCNAFESVRLFYYQRDEIYRVPQECFCQVILNSIFL